MGVSPILCDIEVASMIRMELFRWILILEINALVVQTGAQNSAVEYC